MNTIYALAFVQNTMTTGLIAYRIWRQDKESRGLVGHSLSLMYLVRIIIESASIYVINVLILIILYAIHSNGQYVAQEAIVPTVGKFSELILWSMSIHRPIIFTRYGVHIDDCPSRYAKRTATYDHSAPNDLHEIRHLSWYKYDYRPVNFRTDSWFL